MTETMLRSAVCLALVVASAWTPTAAQSRPSRPIHRLEVSVGAGLFGGAALNEAGVSFRANNVAPQPYPLFTADWELTRSPVVEARVGWLFNRRFAAEVRVGFNRPELRASVRDDVEGAAPVTIVERVDEYVIDGGVAIILEELRAGPLVPFVTVGGGYLRQLHEGRTVIDHGRTFYIGGGAKHSFVAGRRGAIKGAGIRGDARVHLTDGGITVDDALHPRVAVSASLFVGF